MIVSGLVSIVMYSVVIFGIYKVFQIGTDVNEIRDLLRDIKRNTQDISPVPLQAQSPVALSRALNTYSAPPVNAPEPETAATEWDQ
jgi:hypothetical protein